MAETADVGHTAVWEAVGILSAGYDLSLGDALSRIYVRGTELRVHPDDIAAFVLWNGALPD